MGVEFLANVFKIIGGIIVVLNFLGIILLYTANRLSFNKIIGNDLRHIDLKLDGVVNKQNLIETKVVSLGEDVAYIKGCYDTAMNTKTYTRKRKVTKKIKDKK